MPDAAATLVKLVSTEEAAGLGLGVGALAVGAEFD